MCTIHLINKAHKKIISITNSPPHLISNSWDCYRQRSVGVNIDGGLTLIIFKEEREKNKKINSFLILLSVCEKNLSKILSDRALR
jgi:hypothetical protein